MNGHTDVVAECAAVYALSRRFEVRGDKSAHWDVFPSDFDRCFGFRDAWPTMLRNALTSGFNDDTLGAADRWERRRSLDFSDLIPRTDDDAGLTATSKDMYRFCVQQFGEEFTRATLNTEVGSPRLLDIGGLHVGLHDLALTYLAGRVCLAIQKNETVRRQMKQNPTVVEIGGGYGEFVAKMKIVHGNGRFVLIDLPEMGAVQLWYLRHRFPNARILTVRDFRQGTDIFEQPFDFALLPPAFVRLIPKGWPSVFANARSFQEMSWTAVVDYFVEIQRSLAVGGLFACINRYVKRIGDQDITYDRYPFDARWRTVSDAPCAFQPHIREALFERL